MAGVPGPQPPLRVPDESGLASVSSGSQGGQPSHKETLPSMEGNLFLKKNS